MVSKTIVGFILPRVRIPHSPLMLEKKFDSIVILNGTISDDDIALMNFFDCIKIAADGAANILIKNKIFPNYIVGDLDSFDFADLPNTQIINIANQEQYDFEKCLDVLISNNLKKILIFGINGGCLDHTLNNWSIFIKYSSRLKLFCYTCGQVGTLITDDISFITEIDNTISIIPFPSATLTTKGLKWNLDNDKLEFGKSEGARNRSINKNITIKLHSGKYMLFSNYNYCRF